MGLNLNILPCFSEYSITVTPASVRRPSIHPSTFSSMFSPETTGPIKLKFHMEISYA